MLAGYKTSIQNTANEIKKQIDDDALTVYMALFEKDAENGVNYKTVIGGIV